MRSKRYETWNLLDNLTNEELSNLLEAIALQTFTYEEIARIIGRDLGTIRQRTSEGEANR